MTPAINVPTAGSTTSGASTNEGEEAQRQVDVAEREEQHTEQVTTDNCTLKFRLAQEDWKRLRWLAKDLGFRRFEIYTANALRLYVNLYRLHCEDKQLFYGNNPYSALPLELPFRPDEMSDCQECADGTSLGIELTSRPGEVIRHLHDEGSLNQFVWNALWAYYDLMSEYKAGRRLFVGSGGVPEEELQIEPEMQPRR